MMKRKDKATAALMISAIVFVIVYPYQENFWGGLFVSGSLAAVIGGLADWFAVTALFHKPLGISYRTEIIPKNRERLFGEIIQFTANDLLSSENINKIVQRQNMTALLIDFLENSNGKEKIKNVMHEFCGKFLNCLEFKIIGEKLEEILKKALYEVNFHSILSNSLEIIRNKKYDDKIIWFFIQEVILIVRDSRSQQILIQLIDEIKMEYEGESSRRQIMSFIMDLSSQKLASILQGEIIKYLINLQNPLHPQRVQFTEWFYHKVNAKEAEEIINQWKNTMLTENIHFADKIEKYFVGKYNQDKEGTIQYLMSKIDLFLEAKYSEVKENKSIQENIDSQIKKLLETFISAHHDVIVKMVASRLDDFSNEELVSFIETKVADDLQMIRINGSLVGSLVGMVLYIVTYIVERMWL